MSAVRVEPLTAAHAAAVLAVYQEGLDDGGASFETSVPTWAAWDAAHLQGHRLVAVEAAGLDAGEVLGWAALSGVSERCVYAGVAEVSIYVAARARGRGLGRVLLDAVCASSEADGVWTLQAGVFPENEASLALHRAAGFRVVGVRERLGRSADGRWRDVVLLERRSAVAGSG